ncbi:MAG: hypothetical protein MH204_06335, partial [Fimbriimonadaceae bacterium]|nr:hypothetical protein [Fimbriimonadaceae bacterium]
MLTIASVLIFFYDYGFSDRLEITTDRGFEDTLQGMTVSNKESQSHYRILSNALIKESSILFSSEVNELLSDKAFKIKVDAKPEKKEKLKRYLRENGFDLSRVLSEKLRERDKLMFNETKVTLASSITLNTEQVSLYKSDYFSSFLTNGLANQRILKGAEYKSPLLEDHRRFPKSYQQSKPSAHAILLP